jgi:hypothetical protein
MLKIKKLVVRREAIKLLTTQLTSARGGVIVEHVSQVGGNTGCPAIIYSSETTRVPIGYKDTGGSVVIPPNDGDA